MIIVASPDALTKTTIVKPTTRMTKLLTHSSTLSCLAYDDLSNLLERVCWAQFYIQMTPVIYQNVSGRQTYEYGGYVKFYVHYIPPLEMYTKKCEYLVSYLSRN